MPGELILLTGENRDVELTSITRCFDQVFGILLLTDASQAATLLGLFAPLLRKPAKLVPEKVKADLLNIIGNLIPLIPGLCDRSSAVEGISALLASIAGSQKRVEASLAHEEEEAEEEDEDGIGQGMAKLLKMRTNLPHLHPRLFVDLTLLTI
ncbi:hypothetical protein L208DRAFT_1382726 [Tricholoma matsutake]|nr:hypothetical protein L208DRAFT_1382726 [Tricholoma matsutake 945]